MATSKFTQHSKESELEALSTEKGKGIRLSNSRGGKVTRSYHHPSGKGTEAAPVAPYVGKRISKADRPETPTRFI